jgi:phenylacetate-coenzyme A ligase PaaK-like adenylate-forming protein
MDIFDSTIPFEQRALTLFKLQAKQCLVYKEYINHLNINIDSVDKINKIPFLPIEFFKSRMVTSCSEKTAEIIFTSSGTSNQQTSKHYVNDISIYEKSFLQSFEKFYGSINEYRILALLPSYLEREGSSLIYMCQRLIKESQDKQSGFYLNNYSDLLQMFKQETQKKTILIGVSYALIDLAEMGPHNLKNTIVMETGGMKGKRKEISKKLLHQKLQKGFGVEKIHSEYGMTELLSQAYSDGEGIFQTPHWMQVIARSTDDPLSNIGNDVTGGLNIIDLANINSCAFIATQDLGKTLNNNRFEVMGRFDNTEIRGCNLLVQ